MWCLKARMGEGQDWYLVAKDIGKYDLFAALSKYKRTWREVSFAQQVGDEKVGIIDYEHSQVVS